MELRQMEVFARVAALNSITRAAEELFLTQPAVSRSLAALERELGTRLFDRLPRRVELTPAGRVLLKHAERMLQSAGEAAQAVADVRAGVAGRLCLGASSTAATYVLPEILGRFRSEYPHVELSMLTGGSVHVVELVVQNEADLGVVMGFAARPEIQAIPLAEFKSVIITSASHPLAGRSGGQAVRRSGGQEPNPVSLADIADEPLIAMPVGTNLRQFVEDAFRAQGLSPRIGMEMDNVEAIKKMVEAGLGIAILPRLAVEREVEYGRLVALTVAGAGLSHRRVSAIHRPDKYVFAAMKAMIEHLLQEVNTWR